MFLPAHQCFKTQFAKMMSLISENEIIIDIFIQAKYNPSLFSSINCILWSKTGDTEGRILTVNVHLDSI